MRGGKRVQALRACGVGASEARRESRGAGAGGEGASSGAVDGEAAVCMDGSGGPPLQLCHVECPCFNNLHVKWSRRRLTDPFLHVFPGKPCCPVAIILQVLGVGAMSPRLGQAVVLSSHAFVKFKAAGLGDAHACKSWMLQRALSRRRASLGAPARVLLPRADWLDFPAAAANRSLSTIRP
jgi:hypothetical protein